MLLTILANNFVLRRRFAPLESLTRTMEAVDLTLPGVRALGLTRAADGDTYKSDQQDETPVGRCIEH